MNATARAALALCLAALAATPAHAHPVPRQAHHRAVTVRLTPQGLAVDYRLDVDAFTAVNSDLRPLMDEQEWARLETPEAFYDAFARAYAPILGDNLLARVDGRPLPLRFVRQARLLQDETGKALDHLRFDFRFEAPWPGPGRHELRFREANYEYQEGLIDLRLAADPGVEVASRVEPPEDLRTRLGALLRPGEDAKRRTLQATFTVANPSAAQAAPSTERTAGTAGSPPSAAEPPPPSRLHDLLLDSHRGLWLLFLLAAAFGAVHALTPGHGKTLVAAYLVGERGTVWHAVALGLIVTATHTGAVILLAAVVLRLYPDTVPAHVQGALGLGGGLLVAGTGLWLLLRRLANQADHFHIGGGHHHHHHVAPVAAGPGRASPPGGWPALISLGISGGIVPCWDAIAMFILGLAVQRAALALQLLLAFSAGLAGVLVLIGILVVRVRRFAGSRWGSGRLVRALPIASALVVTALGLWLCYDSLHGVPEVEERPAGRAPPGQARVEGVQFLNVGVYPASHQMAQR